MTDPRTDYQVVEGDTHSQLAMAVKDLLSVGWQLQGGVSVAVSNFVDSGGYSGSNYIYSQAMVKT